MRNLFHKDYNIIQAQHFIFRDWIAYMMSQYCKQSINSRFEKLCIIIAIKFKQKLHSELKMRVNYLIDWKMWDKRLESLVTNLLSSSPPPAPMEISSPLNFPIEAFGSSAVEIVVNFDHTFDCSLVHLLKLHTSLKWERRELNAEFYLFRLAHKT